jgi:hypothetical protein
LADIVDIIPKTINSRLIASRVIVTLFYSRGVCVELLMSDNLFAAGFPIVTARVFCVAVGCFAYNKKTEYSGKKY